MFYYPNVLQRHTGCFSTIWLAATRGKKIVRREYLKVNVIRTCQQIIRYVLHEVSPAFAGAPTPRLSLYLSAQLSYGVVCVYHRQCDILIEEMRGTVDRLHRAEKQMRIDLLDSEQQSLLPDGLSLMRMWEDAPDPFFGVMGIPPELPDPTMIPQIRFLLETPSPERIRMEKPPQRRRRGREEDAEYISSPESITLREEERVTLPEIQFTEDLPEVSALELEFLMSDVPPFPEEEPIQKETGREREERERERLREAERERERLREAEKERERLPEAKTERERLRKAKRETERLHDAEREIERLRDEEREREHLHKTERERERLSDAERERVRQMEAESDRERLRESLRELKRLRETGTEDEELQEVLRETERLKKLQREQERRREAERERERLRESERDRERQEEVTREKERLRDAERKIKHLKEALREREGETEKEKRDKERPGEEESVDETRRREVEMMTPGLSPTTGLPLEMGPELDTPILLDDVTGKPILLPTEVTPDKRSPVLVSPVSSLRSPQLPELSLVVLRSPPVPRTRRSRRRLIFDTETQIQRETMAEQIRERPIQTHAAVPVKLPRMTRRTPEDLLGSPTYNRWMSPELLPLWSHCALLEHVRYIQEREQEEQREQETMSELEALRAVTEPSLTLLSSEVSLEVSEDERSRPARLTPEERRAVSELDDRFLPVLPELPETDDLSLGYVQRRLSSSADHIGYSDFLSLAPPSLSRKSASKYFFNCLVLCTQNIIRLQQAEPYGRILITPGPLYAPDRFYPSDI